MTCRDQFSVIGSDLRAQQEGFGQRFPGYRKKLPITENWSRRQHRWAHGGAAADLGWRIIV